MLKSFKTEEELKKFFEDYSEGEIIEITDKTIVHGNSDTNYEYFKECWEIFGEDIMFETYDYDTSGGKAGTIWNSIFYIYNIGKHKIPEDTKLIWIKGDEVSIEMDGSIRIWFD